MGKRGISHKIYFFVWKEINRNVIDGGLNCPFKDLYLPWNPKRKLIYWKKLLNWLSLENKLIFF